MEGLWPTGSRFKLRFTPAQALLLGFAALILLGSLLLWLPFSQAPGEQISYLDAFFTSTSAVCVTGLIVVDTGTHFSVAGQWIVLGLIQAGGLGIMTLSALMMLLMGKRVSLRERLLMQEALGTFSIAGVVRLTRNIILTTLAIEAFGSLLLSLYWLRTYPAGQAVYWGVFHAVSAFNNAGFDLTSASLRPFARDPFVLLVIGGLIILGGIGFFVMEDLWRNRRWERLSLHARLSLRVTGVLIAVGTVLFLAMEYANPQTFGPLPWSDKVFNAWFAAVTPRTAGFESVASGSLLDASLLLTIVLMFVGASPGGTGGGIKTTTFTMIALQIRAMVTGREEVDIMGRRIPRETLDKAATIAAIAMGLVVCITVLLLLTESRSLGDPNSGFSFVRILFEVVSAFGTVGLSTGITPGISAAGKVLLILTMYIGRVGPLTAAMALAQRTIHRNPLHYPEERVMIG